MLLLPLSIFVSSFLPFVAAQGILVDLGYSKYRGQAFSNGISRWLGIRFAAPPLGALRFAAPQDPVATSKTLNATQHGPLCIPTSQYPVPTETSEDCLFLDVYAPSKARNSSKTLPVFFWIQGGGFNANSNANYNGVGLIKASNMSIVVVTFNYRVGPYGFLAGKEIEKGASLNNGLKDQMKALEWVQKHISKVVPFQEPESVRISVNCLKFGGDPNHVVLGGDSAGAASITLLLSAYGGRDDQLFHAAAAESQSFGTMLNVEESQFAYNNLVIRTGCAGNRDTLACLRNLDANTLQQQSFNTPFPKAQIAPLYMYGPTIDQDLVPDYTYRLFEEGRFIKVPVIFGDDTNEGTVFVPKKVSSIGESNTFIQAQFPEIRLQHLARINSMYLQDNSTPTFPNSGHYWRAASNAYGEIRYICPGIFLSSVYAKRGLQSWNYHFAVEDPDAMESGTGVPHTVEVNAIWGPQYVSSPAPPSYLTTNAPIVPTMQGYWTSFIRSFDPNLYRTPESPEWETWGGERAGEAGYRRILVKTGETRMESVDVRQRERCRYLTSIGVDLKQ